MAQPSNENKGISPYVKYGKAHYRYSDELTNWTASLKKGDKAGADRHDRARKKKFGITNALPPNYDEFSYMMDGTDANAG